MVKLLERIMDKFQCNMNRAKEIYLKHRKTNSLKSLYVFLDVLDNYNNIYDYYKQNN